MAVSTVIKHLYDSTITLSDGTSGTPVSLDVLFDQGDLSISGLPETFRELVAYETKGVLHSLRHTSRTYPTGSFTFMISDLSDATSGTVLDFLRRTGSYSTNVSTRGANAEVYTIDITITVEGDDFGDSADHSVTLTDCYCIPDISAGEPDTATVNFTVYGTVTFT